MPMSRKICCVPGCSESGRSNKTLHSFPNPEIERERFNKWVLAVGGDIISLDNKFIYEQRRICRAHFEEKYLCRSNRISNVALPSLNLPGFMNASTFPSVGRRPLVMTQNTPEPLPSTSAALQYNFHAYEDAQKENIAPAPVMDVVETSKVFENFPIEVSTELNTLTGVREEGKRFIRKRGNSNVTASIKTLAERQLYKEVKALRSKLSKCRKAIQIKSASLKAAKKITSNPAFLSAIEKVPIPGKRLIMMQLREVMKKDKGRRFTFNEKVTALSIWKQSPKSYRFLRKILILPAPQTLSKLLCKANISPGINKKTFSQLKAISKKIKPEDKLCILLFDEIFLQANLTYREGQNKIIGFVTDGIDTKPEFADHAQVFMMRGLTRNYKQVLSYTFAQAATKGAELASQIKTVIKELDEAGFTVVATVCDQGSNNRAAIKILTQEAQGFYLRNGQEPKDHVFIVNEKEIVPLYDPPHLMKCIRNNLLTKNLQYKDEKCEKICTAKWDHVSELHDANPGYKGIRLIPKLTDNHVIPSKIHKMKVKYATQVFSRTVASNMGYLAENNILREECKETADMLLFFDNLFDSVNGSYMKKEKMFAKPLLAPAKPNSSHIKFWYEAKKRLKNIKFVNKGTGNVEYVPTIDNWAWTLDGIIVLLNNLNKNYNITSIWMRHLNQDPIENFFGAIRSHGCRNTNPTPDRFTSAFTTLVINNMSSAHAPGANCEKDLCENLESFITLDEVDCTAAPACTLEEIPDINVTNIKEKNDPRIRGPLEYVTGYFCRNVKKNIFKSCVTCHKDMVKNKSSGYIKYREYTGQQWLCNPTESLLICISAVQDIINDVIKQNLIIDCIGEFIKTIILIHVDFDFLKCTIHKDKVIQYLLEATTKFFLFTYCKNINNILVGKRDPEDEDDRFQVKAKKYCNKCFKRKK